MNSEPVNTGCDEIGMVGQPCGIGGVFRLKLGLDITRAVASPSDMRVEEVDLARGVREGDGLGVRLPPAVPIVDDGGGAHEGEDGSGRRRQHQQHPDGVEAGWSHAQKRHR